MKAITDSDFDEVTKEGVVLVDFWAPWCGPCVALAPTLEALSKEYEGKATIVKADMEDNQTIAMRYNIRSIPTLLFFKNGEAMRQLTGSRSKQVIQQELDALC